MADFILAGVEKMWITIVSKVCKKIIFVEKKPGSELVFSLTKLHFCTEFGKEPSFAMNLFGRFRFFSLKAGPIYLILMFYWTLPDL
jgi:hypothetical protein